MLFIIETSLNSIISRILIYVNILHLINVSDNSIFQKADIARMWDLRHDGIKTLFSGALSGFRDRFSTNIISDQVSDIITQFQSLDTITSNAMQDIADHAQNLGELQLSKTFADWAREGEKAQISMEGIYSAIISIYIQPNISDQVTFLLLSERTSDRRTRDDFSNGRAI